MGSGGLEERELHGCGSGGGDPAGAGGSGRGETAPGAPDERPRRARGGQHQAGDPAQRARRKPARNRRAPHQGHRFASRRRGRARGAADDGGSTQTAPPSRATAADPRGPARRTDRAPRPRPAAGDPRQPGRGRMTTRPDTRPTTRRRRHLHQGEGLRSDPRGWRRGGRRLRPTTATRSRRPAPKPHPTDQGAPARRTATRTRKRRKRRNGERRQPRSTPTRTVKFAQQLSTTVEYYKISQNVSPTYPKWSLVKVVGRRGERGKAPGPGAPPERATRAGRERSDQATRRQAPGRGEAAEVG